MPAKQAFTDEQIDILVGVVRKHQKRFKNQTELAKALDITQPALSSMLSGKWHPGVTTARHIAALERMDLEDLLPEWKAAPATARPGTIPAGPERPNLEKCLVWHEDENRWSPWTIAAAREGIYGTGDFAKAEWVGKLDVLEKALLRVRKGAA